MFSQLKKGNYKDFAGQFADVHLSAYSKNHLTSNFSKKKLMEYYGFLVDASDVVVIAMDKPELESNELGNSTLLGFIVAGERVSDGVGKFVRKNTFYLFSILLRHPAMLFQKIKASLCTKVLKGPGSLVKFRLLSICVRAGGRSKGVGSGMLAFFEEIIRSRGIECYGLSVRKNNSRAISFYEKNGFFHEKKHLESCYFIKRLKTNA